MVVPLGELLFLVGKLCNLSHAISDAPPKLMFKNGCRYGVATLTRADLVPHDFAVGACVDCARNIQRSSQIDGEGVGNTGTLEGGRRATGGGGGADACRRRGASAAWPQAARTRPQTGGRGWQTAPGAGSSRKGCPGQPPTSEDTTASSSWRRPPRAGGAGEKAGGASVGSHADTLTQTTRKETGKTIGIP